MPVETGAASPTRFAVGRLGHHRGGGGGEPPRALVSSGLFCVLIIRDARMVSVLGSWHWILGSSPRMTVPVETGAASPTRFAVGRLGQIRRDAHAVPA